MNEPRVLSLVWNLIRGGTEGQCARLAMLLAQRGHAHRVAVFRREGFFLDDVERLCGPVHTVAIEHLLGFETLRQVRALRDLLLEESIDLLHAWDADAAIFGSWAARWAGVSYMTSRRDLGEIYPRHKLWLMNRADRGAVATVANARAIATPLCRAGLPESKVHVLPNILDHVEFDRLAARPFPWMPRDVRCPVVGMVARLDPEKDVPTFLRAVAALKERRLLAVIAGDGVERPGLESLARELGLSECVVFLGEVNDVPALLKHFTLGVLVPNANEGLSNTVLEYMAAGLPSVVTDCGGNAELVKEGETGFVVPVGDAPALASAIKKLLDDRERSVAMGRAARDRVESDFAPAAVADRFADLYRRLIRGA